MNITNITGITMNITNVKWDKNEHSNFSGMIMNITNVNGIIMNITNKLCGIIMNTINKLSGKWSTNLQTGWFYPHHTTLSITTFLCGSYWKRRSAFICMRWSLECRDRAQIFYISKPWNVVKPWKQHKAWISVNKMLVLNATTDLQCKLKRLREK